MSLLNKYPRYTKRIKLKATLDGMTPPYIVALRERLRAEWSEKHERIAGELATGDLSEFRHWLQALVEATHDIESGMAPCETSLPGLSELVHEHGQNMRLLYTALFVLSCWELGLTSSSSEGALAKEAQMAGLGPRALLELLKKAEPVREAVSSADRPPMPIDGEWTEEAGVQSIVVNAVSTHRSADNPQAELAAVLRDRFRQVEREILLRRLGINPEDVKLNPLTREDFVWAMVSYAEQRARLGDLWDAVEGERPGAFIRPNPFRSR